MSTMIKRILGILLSVICIVGGTGVCALICCHPSEEVENTVSSFYREPEDTLDVVMIGSSAANKDFYPTVLWREGRITGYCMAVGACSGNIYTSILREVLSRQPNALILVDADGFLVDDEFQREQDPIRLWLDSMPRGENRTQTIRELCPDAMFERTFPFVRYHRNMTSLKTFIPITVRLLKKQILHQRDPMKGATTNDKSNPPAMQMLPTGDLPAQPLDTLSMQAFESFLQFCKQQHLSRVLFVDLPKTVRDDDTRERFALYEGRMKTISRLAQENGFGAFTYNALDNPAQLDASTEFADTLHLTTQGAVKFSAFFSQYLLDAYTFPEKSAQTIAQWEADVQ